GGWVARDVVDARGTQKSSHIDARQKHRVEVGTDIPTPSEVRAIIGKLDGGRRRPLLLTAIFTGLRVSELRGLRWADVNLPRSELRVRQRADRYGTIGPPKSATSRRTVPLPPMVVNGLREWRLANPRVQSELVFPRCRD